MPGCMDDAVHNHLQHFVCGPVFKPCILKADCSNTGSDNHAGSGRDSRGDRGPHVLKSRIPVPARGHRSHNGVPIPAPTISTQDRQPCKATTHTRRRRTTRKRRRKPCASGRWCEPGQASSGPTGSKAGLAITEYLDGGSVHVSGVRVCLG